MCLSIFQLQVYLTQGTGREVLVSVKDGSPRNMCRKSGSDIKVSSISDTGYWEGSVGEREGWFPSEHVQEVRLRHKGE